MMEIKKIDQDFSVCKVVDYSLVNLNAEYSFIGKTDEEKSLVCDYSGASAYFGRSSAHPDRALAHLM